MNKSPGDPSRVIYGTSKVFSFEWCDVQFESLCFHTEKPEWFLLSSFRMTKPIQQIVALNNPGPEDPAKYGLNSFHLF